MVLGTHLSTHISKSKLCKIKNSMPFSRTIMRERLKSLRYVWHFQIAKNHPFWPVICDLEKFMENWNFLWERGRLRIDRDGEV